MNGHFKNPISKIYKRAAFFLGIAVCNIFFSNCAPSSSSNDPQSGGSTLWQGAALKDISPLQGTWIQGRCTAISGGSVKTFYKVTKTAADQVHLDAGNLYYSGNAACSGTGVNTGETAIGTALFAGTDDYGSKKYYYALLKMVSGLEQNYIFALKSSSTLCIFTRTSDLETAQDVNSFVNAINNADCYSK